MKFKVLIQVLITFLTISYFGVVFPTAVNLTVGTNMETARKHISDDNYEFAEDLPIAPNAQETFKAAFFEKSSIDSEFSNEAIPPHHHKKVHSHYKKMNHNYDVKFPPNVDFQENRDIDMSTKESFKSHAKCKQKTGILYFISEDHKHHKNAKPVFIVLNENSFSIMLNKLPNSLIKSVILERILRVTQANTKTTCFELIEDKKETTPIKICSETKEEMDEWIVAILEFKECLLKEKFELIDANSNAFAKDSAKRKKIEANIKKGKGYTPHAKIFRTATATDPAAIVETINKPLGVQEALFYTNTFTPTQEILEIKETDDELTKILNDKKREEIAQRQIKRQLDDRLRAAKEAHAKVVLEQKKLVRKNIIQKKKAIAIATHKIEALAKTQEKKVLMEALHSMQEMNVIIKQFKNFIRNKIYKSIKLQLVDRSLQKRKKQGQLYTEL